MADESRGAGMQPEGPDGEVLIGVDGTKLPRPAAAALDQALPLDPANAFLPRQPRSVAGVTGLAALAIAGLGIGVGALVTAVRGLASWDEPGAVFVSSVLAAAALLGSGILTAQVRTGIRERREWATGRSRLGLHLVGDSGLLIAGPGGCTWVPRSRVPESTHHLGSGGSRGTEVRALVIVDGRGDATTVFVPGPVGHDIDRWRRDGTLPAWPPPTGRR